MTSIVQKKDIEKGERLARIVSLSVVLGGFLVLVAWVFGLESVKSIFPKLATIKVNTAICFILIGSSLWLALADRLEATSLLRKGTIFLGCGTVLAISLASVGEYCFGIDLGIDQLLVLDSASPPTAPPGRMAIPTAFALIIFSVAVMLLLPAGNRTWRPFTVGTLSLFGIATGLFTLLAGAAGVVPAGRSLPTVALPTSLLMIALGAALTILVWQESGLKWLLSRRLTAGVGVAAILTLSLGVASYRLASQQAELTGFRLRTHKFVNLAWTAYNGILEMEDIQRTYLLTSQDQDWRRACAAMASTTEACHHMRSAAGLSASQAREIGIVTELVQGRIELAKRTIEVYRHDGPAPALQLIKNGHGNRLTADIGRRLSVVRGEAELALDTREAATASNIASLQAMVFVGTLLVAVLFSGVLWLLNREISERRQAENELRSSESRLRSIWERSADGMRLTDGEGRILAVNEAYCQLVKLPREKLEGQIFSVVYKGHGPSDGIDVYQRRFQTGEIVPRLSSRTELWNSSVVELEIANSFIEFGHQKRALLSVFRDVTQRTALEEHLRQSQRLESIGRLAGGVAHDFNNLLVVIGGHAELMLMNPRQLGPGMSEGLQQIKAAAERAANLTRQLLAFGRKQMMQPKALLLNDVISNLTKMLHRIIGEDIQLQCLYGAGLPHVLADPGMVEQVLVNLVVNARDAMPGGGLLSIATTKVTLDETSANRTREALPGEYVCVTVQDSGVGIAPENLSRIFEPFFTTKKVGQGTGLGLATVYGIAKQHQGWVEVTSQPGAGAAFRVYFPCVAAPAQAAAPAPEDTPLPRGTETILLVEDDEAVRVTTRCALERFGYKVEEAACAREALERWEHCKNDVALLLTDIVMPGGLNGRELAEKLQAAEPRLKVILMSGYSEEIAGKDTEYFRRTRIHFLTKPCSTKNLIETIRTSLDAAAQAARN